MSVSVSISIFIRFCIFVFVGGAILDTKGYLGFYVFVVRCSDRQRALCLKFYPDLFLVFPSLRLVIVLSFGWGCDSIVFFFWRFLFLVILRIDVYFSCCLVLLLFS